MVGTDPFLWIGEPDPDSDPFHDPDTDHPLVTRSRSRSSLYYPIPISIRIGSPINDPAHHCIRVIDYTTLVIMYKILYTELCLTFVTNIMMK